MRKEEEKPRIRGRQKVENIRGRGFTDRSCCDRPRSPAAIRALDDRDEREGEKQRKSKREREGRGRGKKSIGPVHYHTLLVGLRAGQWYVFAITPDK